MEVYMCNTMGRPHGGPRGNPRDSQNQMSGDGVHSHPLGQRKCKCAPKERIGTLDGALNFFKDLQMLERPVTVEHAFRISLGLHHGHTPPT